MAVSIAVIMSCVLIGNFGLNSMNYNSINLNSELESWGEPKVSSQYSAEWLTNGDFSSISSWYNTTGGDTSDVNGTYSNEQANFVMLGDNGEFTVITEEVYPNQTGTWWAENNSQSYPVSPAVPRTPAYGIDTEGWWCSHEFKEGGQAWTTDNNPAVEFKRNYSLNVDLSDYSITSIHVNATVNGTVYATDQSQNGGIEVPGDNIPDHAANYDWARFYIKAENIERTHVYELAYFNTLDVLLGRDTHQDAGGLDYLNNTFLTAQDQEILIAYLSAIFQNTAYGTFTIALGIEVYCEDNVSTEMDKWVELRFVDFEFNFTYEKKMTRYAQVSWNQVGNQLNGSVYQIDEARLNFKYKSNQVWPTTLSPNSEIRAYINNRRHSEVIKLTDVNGTWKEAKLGGFDVTSIVSTDENITLTIQVIIMDNFNLNSTYTLSIDNASLMIYYSHKTGTETDTDFEIYLNGTDETLSKATTAKIGETVNVTFIYKDIFNAFIDSAAVTITIGADTKNLIEMSSYYYIIVNTSALSLGENFHTISASRITYESQEEQIKIEVFSLDTSIHLFLDQVNKTIEKSIDVNYGEDVNITVQYRNTESVPSTHVNNATVILTGTGSTLNLTENYAKEYYNITINSEILGLGITYLTVNAQKENYSTQNIVFKVEVSTRGTYIDRVFINNTETYTFEVPWKDVFNITMSYNDTETNDFISNATVGIEGSSYSAILKEDIDNQLYRVTVNSSQLQIGINYLSISAQKVNYSIASQLITITITQRETEMDVYLNQTLGTVIEIKWDEELNITAIYSDSGIFLNGASVSLKEGSTILYNFSKHPDFDIYNLTINTAILDIGVNALTVYAKLENYSYSLESIMIIVFERESDLTTYINQTPSISIEIAHGELLNISAIYEDKETGTFVNGSLVSLKEGSTILYNFTIHPDFDIYNLTVNTADFGIGVQVLTIYAKADYYTASLESIIINVVERETSLDTYLNQTSSVSIEIAYDELLNITAVYNDLATGFVNGATVTLKDGSTVLYNLIKNPNLDIYNVTVNTVDFGLGVRALTIYAKKDNYTVSLESITINIVERDTLQEVYLNGNQTSTIEIAYDEILNISTKFSDKHSGLFLTNADVYLKEGSTVLYNFTELPLSEIYNLTINTKNLSLGLNVLTIECNLENHTVSLETLTISVIARETYIEIFLNDEDKTSEKSISLSSGEILNITILYKDVLTGAFIDSATLQLIGENISGPLDEDSNPDYYNFTVDTALLEVGVSFLSILAQKPNYESTSAVLTVIVAERKATYDLFLNNISKTVEKSITLTINMTLNITLIYKDFLENYTLANATITLTGGAISETFIENISGNYYYILINSSDLNQGINFLNILAQRNNYESLAILLTISIEERQTDVIVLLDDLDITNAPSKKVPVNSYMNFTVIYTDNSTGAFVSDATVRLIGEGRNDTFTPHSGYYSLNISAEVLNRGINFLTIYVQKNNYEPYSLIVTIEIIDKPSDWEIFLNTLNKTQEKAIDLPIGTELNITVRYLENSTRYLIQNATITVLGEGLSEILNESTNYYSILINTSQLDIGIRILTIIAEKDNYQTISTTLRINVQRIDTNITTTSGEPNVEVEVGIQPKLEIVLNDIDFNGTITDATVQYSWIYGTGTLEDEDGDGIYEVSLENAPPGTYTVTVTAYAGDDYDFERYYVTITVNKPTTTGGDNTFFIVFLVTLILLICVAGYAVLYQKRLKIPKPIRKLRRYRRTLKRVKGVENIEIIGRKDAIDEIYNGFIDKVSKNLKEKEATVETASLMAEEVALQSKK